VTGAADGGGEIGHMTMLLGGPKCGCGSRGCFEALAGRLAIERDIRAAIADGRKSIVSNLIDLDKPGERIRSGTLRKALNKGDAVVTEVIDQAAEIMGLACLSIRRVIDPEVFLFGGGVIEACGGYILPIVEKVIQGDPLAAPKPAGRVLESALGDDAVALGAVALAQQQLGGDPFAAARNVSYPEVTHADGRVVVDGEGRDAFLLRADGELMTADAMDPKLVSDLARGRLGDRAIRQLCQGRPHTVFVALPAAEPLKLSDRAQTTLHFHDLRLEMLPASQAVAAFNDFAGRKALLLPGPLTSEK
jgi:glucokinase